MIKMKLSMRIPLTLTVIVLMTGIVALIRRAASGKAPFPTSYVIIWIIVSVILIGITVWSWLRTKKE